MSGQTFEDIAKEAAAEAAAGGGDSALGEIAQAIEGAVPVEGEVKKPQKKVSVVNAVNRIKTARPYVEDGDGTLWSWNGQHWIEVKKATLRAIAFEAVDGRGNFETWGEIGNRLRAFCHKRDLAWGQVADHEIPVLNGVLDAVSGALRDHRPEDYLENVIPHELVEGGVAAELSPVLFAALATWFGEDLQAVDAFQEFAGYVLLPHAKLKKALLLFGPGDTGKSQAVLVLRLLVGAGLSCQLSIENMDDVKLRSVLVGKRLNVMTELSQRAFAADSGFKTLVSTEEPIMVDVKYKPTFDYKSRAKHVIATNNAPRVTQRTAEIFNRFLIVPMSNVLPLHQQDHDIETKLDGEMAGIFLWALAGARRLIENDGVFTTVTSGDQVLAQWRAELNPMTTYIPENYAYQPGARSPLAAIAAHFRRDTRRKADSRQVGVWVREMGLKVDNARPLDKRRQVVKCLFDWIRHKSQGDYTELDLEGGPDQLKALDEITE